MEFAISLPERPAVVNIGLESFIPALHAQNVKCVQLDWKPSFGGNAALAGMVARMDDKDAGIGAANREALRRIQESGAVLVDIRKAVDVIPGMTERSIFHAGAPVEWDNMCGPMRGAITGACLYEGWIKKPEDVAAFAKSGEVKFDSAHHHRSIGPMAGIITPSMLVHVVRNEAYNIECYSTLYMGIGKVLRHGAFSQEVIDKLIWMNSELGGVLKKAILRSGGIDIKAIIAQSLQMGDELHNRNKASNALYLTELAPHIVSVADTPAQAEKVIRFIIDAQHFILNSVMASCKAMLSAGNGIDKSTVVTAIARNGYQTGIQVSGLGSEWFTAPAPKIDGVYFPGYTADDANRDIGDSAITETIGLGSLSMATAPAVVKYVGGTTKFATETTMKLYEICVGEHNTFQIPNLNFAGSPFGIDIRKVVQTGITPVINTGISHKNPGIGQIGAGLTAAPLECFVKAVQRYDEKYR